MSNQNKVVADYSQNSQELALMPAELAKKLLVMYAESLTKSSPREIIGSHIDELRAIMSSSSENRVMEAANCSLNFYNERQLIVNIATGNLDAYKVVTKEEVLLDIKA